MNKAPKITQEHLDAAADQMSGYELMLDFVNKVIEIALAEQQEITAFAKKRSGMEFDEWQGKPPQQEGEYITAAQARELGAGNVIFRVIGGTHWYICDKYCNFPEIGYQYRAIKQAQPEHPESRYVRQSNELDCPTCGGSGHKDDVKAQPEPVDPHAALRAEYIRQRDAVPCELRFYKWEFLYFATNEWRVIPIGEKPAFINPVKYRYTNISCYVSKDGEPAIRMLRTEAQELQRKLGDTVWWSWLAVDKLSSCQCSNENDFSRKGTYTYRTKATIKLDGNMVTPEQAAAEWEAKKETHEVWYKSDNFPEAQVLETFSGKYTHDWNKQAQVNGAEYELRPKHPTWTGSREDVIALLKEVGVV